MLSAKALSELLHKLYSAAESDALWPEFLGDLSRHLNLTGASIIHHDMERGRYNAEFSWGNEDWKPGYQTYYGPLDMWRTRFLERPVGQFALGKDLCSLREARNTEFYNDHARKWDLDLVGAVATIKRPTQLETVNLYQSWKGPTPDASVAAETMALLFPHLEMALSLRRKFVVLRSYTSTLESAFDASATAIMLLDCEGRIVHLNRSAESLLSARHGMSIDGGYLRTLSATEQASLNALVHRIVTGVKGGHLCHGGSILISRPRRRPLALTAAPLINSITAVFPAAAVILFVYDPDACVRPPIELLREGFRLTPAEASVAMLIVEGKSLAQVAVHRSVTYNTVKQQMKTIFLKTHTRNQAELIRLLMRTVLIGSQSPPRNV
jgi:DNA-binding CsgD family transcriptional regulator/PAS domain-containing protein